MFGTQYIFRMPDQQMNESQNIQARRNHRYIYCNFLLLQMRYDEQAKLRTFIH